MGGLKIHVQSWGAWLGKEHVFSSSDLSEMPLPLALKRRITPVGRQLLELAWRIYPKRAVPPRIILTSRHSEFSRTFELIKSLYQEGELSPADFSLAVHHGLAGLLSITTDNRQGHTALAAGNDSLAYGLIEAATCIEEGDDSVLLLHFDEVLPDFFNELIAQPGKPIAMALLLTKEDHGTQHFSMTLRPGSGRSDVDLAHSFLELLTAKVSHVVACGERLDWQWDADAAMAR